MISEMDRTFDLDEADALMPEVLARTAVLVDLRADLAELTHDLRATGHSRLGGVAEAKGLEARLSESFGWFTETGIEVKGIAPFLIDFPSVLDGESVRLCWLEGESSLAWYHLTTLGFPGRRRIP